MYWILHSTIIVVGLAFYLIDMIQKRIDRKIIKVRNIKE